MQAAEVVFQQLLDGKIQYRVPLFQRTYSWGEDNWQTLWDDILEIYAMPQPRSHFIGAVVTLPIPDAPQNSAKFMLIDGQQRLTTLFVLLSVIRDTAKETSLDHLAAQIDFQCLINQFATIPGEREKMRPTQQDRPTLTAVIAGSSSDVSGRIGQAQRYYRSLLVKGDLDGERIDLERLMMCITSYLSLVSIRLDQSDSPHRIFESLNNTGMPLTGSDLIRNHIFMRIPTEREQDLAYSTYWYPIQQRLEAGSSNNEMTDFFWRYLMKSGALPRYDEVFEGMRILIEQKTSSASLLQFLGELSSHSEYYVKLRKPGEYETDPTIREQLIRLNQWEVAVSYPFLLHAMQKRGAGVIGNVELLTVLRMLESYVVRRIVCNIPTNRLRSIFARMSLQISDDNFVESSRHFLIDNDWPNDTIFYEMFRQVPVYNQSRLSRTRLILTSLEESFHHPEQVKMTDQITVEHIMPQTLNEDWMRELGPNAREIHGRYLHTIGNLTYTGQNSEMGNAPFEEKKGILSQSHFELNGDVVHCARWTEEEISVRALDLADRALRIWERAG